MIWRVVVSLAGMSALGLLISPASADIVSDVQGMPSIYKGSFEIDAQNPASLLIETLMASQTIEIRLTSKPLGTAFFSVFHGNYVKAAEATFGSAVPVPVWFTKFQFYLDGCNISKPITELCNANDCWANSPAENRSVEENASDAFLARDFSMGHSIFLNDLDLSECPVNTVKDFLADRKYKVEFREAKEVDCPAVYAGGRADYEIVLRNKVFQKN